MRFEDLVTCEFGKLADKLTAEHRSRVQALETHLLSVKQCSTDALNTVCVSDLEASQGPQTWTSAWSCPASPATHEPKLEHASTLPTVGDHGGGLATQGCVTSLLSPVQPAGMMLVSSGQRTSDDRGQDAFKLGDIHNPVNSRPNTSPAGPVGPAFCLQVCQEQTIMECCASSAPANAWATPTNKAFDVPTTDADNRITTERGSDTVLSVKSLSVKKSSVRLSPQSRGASKDTSGSDDHGVHKVLSNDSLNSGSGSSSGSENARKSSLRRTASQIHFEVLPEWTMTSDKGGRQMLKRAAPCGKSSGEALIRGVSEADVLWKCREDPSLLERLVMHPSSWQHLTWDALGLLLISYDCIVIPLGFFGPEDNDFMDYMTWVVRFFWTLNMVVSSLTGVMLPEGVVEMNPQKVFKRYAWTWMPLDIIIVGFDWIEFMISRFATSDLGSSGLGNGLRSFRILRTLRVLRLVRVPHNLKFILERCRSEQVGLVATIVKIVIFMLLFTHFLACSFYGFSRAVRHTSSIQGRDSWVVLAEEDTLQSRYLLSVQWALYQFFGEAFIDAANLGERVFIIIALFFAFMLATYISSNLTTAMTRIHIIASKQSSLMSLLRRYLHDRDISAQLSVRVLSNAQHLLGKQQQETTENSIELLKVISEPLLVELHFEIHSGTLMTHPFFDCYYIVNQMGISRVCHMALSDLMLATGDVVFNVHETPHCPRMFFVKTGALVYRQKGEKTNVQEGDWLCEATIWTSWTHVGTLRASDDAVLLMVEREEFSKCIGGFPSQHARLYAHHYVKRLNAMDQSDLTDVGVCNKGMARDIVRVFGVDEQHIPGLKQMNWDEDWDTRSSGTNSSLRVAWERSTRQNLKSPKSSRAARTTRRMSKAGAVVSSFMPRISVRPMNASRSYGIGSASLAAFRSGGGDSTQSETNSAGTQSVTIRKSNLGFNVVQRGPSSKFAKERRSQSPQASLQAQASQPHLLNVKSTDWMDDEHEVRRQSSGEVGLVSVSNRTPGLRASRTQRSFRQNSGSLLGEPRLQRCETERISLRHSSGSLVEEDYVDPNEGFGIHPPLSFR